MKNLNLLKAIMNLPLVQLCIGFLLGTLIGYWLERLWLILITVICLLVVRRGKYLLLVGLIIGITYLGWFMDSRNRLATFNYSGVAEVMEILAKKDFQQQVVVELTMPGLAVIDMDTYLDIQPGQHLLVKGEFNKLEADASYLLYMNSKDVFWKGKKVSYEVVETHTLNSYFSQIKSQILAQISRNLPEPEASLVSGIIVGGSTGFSSTLEEQLKASGTSHIVSISGYNVTMITLALLAFAGKLPRRLVTWGSIVCLGIFILVIGWENLPARRAVMMGEILLLTNLIGRPYSVWFSLLYVIVLMVIENPLVWYNVSFQLSVGAMLGILLFTKYWQCLFRKLHNSLQETLSASLAVMMTTLPISLAWFGEFSLVNIPSNLTILPFIPALTFTAIIALIVSYLIPSFYTGLVFYPVYLIATTVRNLVSFWGSIPGIVSSNVSLGLIVIGLLWVIYLLMVRYQKLSPLN